MVDMVDMVDFVYRSFRPLYGVLQWSLSSAGCQRVTVVTMCSWPCAGLNRHMNAASRSPVLGLLDKKKGLTLEKLEAMVPARLQSSPQCDTFFLPELTE